MKKIIHRLAHNPYATLFVGIVVCLTGFIEVWETIVEDLAEGDVSGHHGVMVLGFWHMIRAIAEIIHSTEYLDGGMSAGED
ncbi:MAG: hypothetical protein HQL54_07085 [Magnetococcales bacterium]|nr:hypothetical protein [Magnetococcales bacterium]